MCKADKSYIDENNVKLVFDKKNESLIVGDILKILTGTENSKTIDHRVEVLSVTDDGCTVKSWGTGDCKDHEVFVYGKQVDDFHNVDKEQLGILALKGVQELYDLIQTERNLRTQSDQELHSIIKEQDIQIKEQNKTINTMLVQIAQLTEAVNKLTK